MNPLMDVMSPKARKYFYACVSLAAFGWGIYVANNGDWRAIVPSVLGIAAGALAHANTNPVDPQQFTPAPPKTVVPDGTASGGPAD